MAKSRFIQNNFTSGVLSPLLKGRTDLPQYYNSVEVGNNFVVIPQGGIKRRGGTRHIDTALTTIQKIATIPTMPNGGTAANINDGDDNTYATTTVNIGTTNPYVIAEYDLGAAKTLQFADIRGIYYTSLEDAFGVYVSYSDDGVSWAAFGVVTQGIKTTERFFRLDLSSYGSHRYWRLHKSSITDLGTDKCTLSEFSLWERAAPPSRVKLESFSVSSSEQYLLAFTDQNCRVYRKKPPSESDLSSTYRWDITMPYLSADVEALRVVQTENVMLIFHEDYPVKRIVLDANVWFDDDFVFSNIPQYDFNDALSPTPTNEVQILTFVNGIGTWTEGDTFQIDVESVISKNITFAGDTTAAEHSATAENIRKNLQEMPVFGATGVAVARTGVLAYTVTISGESAKPFELFSGFPTSGTAAKKITVTRTSVGVARKEDLWSATRGYPKLAAFYEGRLVIGGTRDKPQTLLFSKAGLYNDFDIDDGDDDEGIFITLFSKKLADIVDIYSGRDLQIFTAGAEFAVFESPITPSSISVKNQTSYGSSGIQSKELDGAVFFFDRSGKSLKEYVFSFNENAYVGKDISVLSPELINSPVDYTILGGSSSDDANWVLIINSDGSGTILNTLREQDIKAFTKWTTTGALLSCVTVDDQLYMVNKRTINGAESYEIEQWGFSRYLDNSYYLQHTPLVTVIYNLEHLEGETVTIVAEDGTVLPPRVVSGGSVTLDVDESDHTYFEVGLPFTCTLQPMPVNTSIGSGENQLHIKKIVKMNIRVKDSSGIYIDGQLASITDYGESPAYSPNQSKTGVIEDYYPSSGWGRYNAMPIITLPDPTPATILAIEYEVESS